MYITNTCKHHKYNTDRIEVLFCFPFFTYQGHAGMGSFAQFLLLGVSEPFLHCSHLHLSAALSYTSKLVLIEQMNIKTTNGKLSYSQFVISEIFSSPGSNGCSEPCTLKCCSGHLDARSPIAEWEAHSGDAHLHRTCIFQGTSNCLLTMMHWFFFSFPNPTNESVPANLPSIDCNVSIHSYRCMRKPSLWLLPAYFKLTPRTVCDIKNPHITVVLFITNSSNNIDLHRCALFRIQ